MAPDRRRRGPWYRRAWSALGDAWERVSAWLRKHGEVVFLLIRIVVFLLRVIGLLSRPRAFPTATLRRRRR